MQVAKDDKLKLPRPATSGQDRPDIPETSDEEEDDKGKAQRITGPAEAFPRTASDYRTHRRACSLVNMFSVAQRRS